MEILKKFFGWLIAIFSIFLFLCFFIVGNTSDPTAFIAAIIMIPFMMLGFKLNKRHPLKWLLFKINGVPRSLKKDIQHEKEKNLKDLNSFKSQILSKKEQLNNEMKNWEKVKKIQEVLLLLQIRIDSMKLKELDQELTVNKKIYSLETIDSMIEEKRVQFKNLDDSFSSMKNELNSLKAATIENKKRFLVTGKIIHNYELNSIKSMDGYEFEKYVAYLFKFLDYKNIFRTQDSNDQGIDVIAEKDNLKYGIQCKLYSAPVGNAAIQQAIAGKVFYKLDKAIVITNSSFTDSAKTLANGTNTKIVDKSGLDELIYKVACYGNYIPYGYDNKKAEIKVLNK